MSTAPKPGDIDLVNFYDVHAFQSLSLEIKGMIINQYFKGEETAKYCHCDSYFVPRPSPEHQLKEDFLIIRDYWENELGCDHQGRKKGIISCLIKHLETKDTTAQTDAESA